MAEKRKHKQAYDWRKFLFWWTAVGGLFALVQIVIGGILTQIIPMELLQTLVGAVVLNVIIAISVGIALGIGQQVVMFRFSGLSIPQWWWITAVGFTLSSVMTFVLIFLLTASNPTSPNLGGIGIILVIVLSGTIPAVMQATLLQNHFDRVWIYVLTFIISGLIPIVITPLQILSPIILGLVTGSTLLWLDYTTQKKKNIESV